MLSSDKNVETIVQLGEVIKHYLGLQGEYLKLEIVDKLVRLLAAMAISVLFLIVIMCLGFYFSLAFAFWLSLYIGYAPAFIIVGCLHLLIFLLFCYNRKTWIERPLVHFFVNLIMS